MLNETARNTPTTSTGLAARWERRIARAVMEPIFRSGSKMIRYNNLKESLVELDPFLDQTSLLVIVMNHISHSDIIPGIRLVEAVKLRFGDRVNNFYIPVAKSLVDGKQGHIVQLFYSEGTLPLCVQQNLRPLPLVTENDQKKRHMKQSLSEQRQLHHAVLEKGSALLVFAEGSVEGGRYDTFRNARGTQKVTNPFLPHVFQKAHEAGKTVIVLPIGISGTNKMLSAESLFLTWRSIGALLEDRVLKRPPILATVTVGRPYEYSPGISWKHLTRHVQEVNDDIMKSIIPLIPPGEKGYYGSSRIREYQQDMQDYEKFRPFLRAPWRIFFHELPSILP